MTSSFTLESAKGYGKVFIAILSLLSVIYPEIGFGASLQASRANQVLIFEVQDPKLIEAKQNFLTLEQVVKNDPLTNKLREYLEQHNSPLAEYAEKIPQNPQWKRALAISWVESNYGKRCANNNCSGIGVAPGHPAWRKYVTKYDWFVDMCRLMETDRYKNKYTTFRAMKGIYVYPGTENWVLGAEKKYAELSAMEKEAIEERTHLAHSSTVVPVRESVAGAIELADLK